jgi:cellulose synthase/poly-beta-1,6-N-acetylglucosamine synthase-like glycosyltransferase
LKNQVTIIIPTIKINSLLIEVVENILENTPNLSIHIVTNQNSKIFPPKKNIKIILTGSKNMSKKRNLGVQAANTEFVGFVDSDAYPNKDWLSNGIKILEKNSEVGIVTGPELSFPNQSFMENIVGFCNQSFLITGSHSFRKTLSSSRFYSEASGCNILMRKEDYLLLNGMDEDLYLGEDREFSERLINKLKKKIYFSKESWVYHKDRSLIGFFFQRLARGEAINDTIQVIIKSLKKNLSIRNLFNQRLELFIPIFFLIFLFSYFLIFFLNDWKYIYFTIIILYFSIILLSSFRLCRFKFHYFPFILLTLTVGTLAPGIAQLSKLLRIKFEISKFYRNSNDE